MARVLGQLPERLELVAVEGLDFGEGEGLSEVLERAAEMQLDELEALLRGAV